MGDPSGAGGGPSRRRLFVSTVAGISLASWLLAAIHQLGLWSFADSLPVTLQGFFAFAGALGWLCGNVFVRSRIWRRSSFVFWWLAPQGLGALVWAMSPAILQKAQPSAPFLALAVSLVFFAVPWFLRPPQFRS